jgi:hypothetical protein
MTMRTQCSSLAALKALHCALRMRFTVKGSAKEAVACRSSAAHSLLALH